MYSVTVIGPSSKLQFPETHRHTSRSWQNCMTPTWEKAEPFTSLIITFLMEIGNNWLINYNRVLINSPQETTNALTWIKDLMCFAMALSSSTLAKLASTSTPPHPIHLIHHHCPWLQNLWSLLLLLLICNVDVVGKSVGLGKLTRLFFHNLENLQFRCDLSFVLYEMVQTYPVVTVCHDGLVMCIHTTRIRDVVLKCLEITRAEWIADPVLHYIPKPLREVNHGVNQHLSMKKGCLFVLYVLFVLFVMLRSPKPHAGDIEFFSSIVNEITQKMVLEGKISWVTSSHLGQWHRLH